MLIRSTILLCLLATASQTNSCGKKIPIWRGKIYVGNYLDGSIDRAQELETISTHDPKFDGFLCIPQKDFDCFFETYIVNASGWAKQSACGLENHGH